MGRRLLSCVLFFLMWMPCGFLYLTTASGANSSPRTAEQKLREHHIGFTTPELIAALKSSDPEVRSLAAIALADLHPQDAANPISEAEATEKNPSVRVDFGFTLMRLGDPKGGADLKTLCNKEDIPGYLRLRAASYLDFESRGGCLGAVLAVLRSDTDTDTRAQALSMLPGYANLSPESGVELKRITIALLSDPTPSVRIAASNSLAQLGSRSDAHYLNSSIAVEQNDTVRLAMKSALERLQSEQQ